MLRRGQLEDRRRRGHREPHDSPGREDFGQLRRALEDDSLTPDEAAKLAGRVSFLTQAAFGSVVKAATKAVYARAADAAACSSSALSTGLSAALRSLVCILPTIRPKFIPFRAENIDVAIFYTPSSRTTSSSARRGTCRYVPVGVFPMPKQRASNG